MKQLQDIIYSSLAVTCLIPPNPSTKIEFQNQNKPIGIFPFLCDKHEMTETRMF